MKASDRSKNLEWLPKDCDLRPSGIGEAVSFASEWAAAAAGVPGAPNVLNVFCRKQGWGPLYLDQSIVQQPLKLAGRVFAKGLGTHADGEIVLRANRPIRSLRAWAGMDDNEDARGHESNKGGVGRLVFAVLSGDKELWRSAALGVASEPARVDLAVGGVRELRLTVREINGNIARAHADWADVEVELADGTVVRPAAGVFADQPLPTDALPFSFKFGGRPSSEVLPGWPVTRKSRAGADGAAVHVVTWRDPQSGLECELELQTFAGFPAVEWVMRFRNTGKKDTPLIEDIRPLDTGWVATGGANLRRSVGSPQSITDFLFQIDALAAGQSISMVAGGGRSSDNWVPFFNLQTGGTGVITGIGWSGQWAADYSRDAAGVIHLKAGQELTRLVLHAGEEIRTPRILLLFWSGDTQDSHNTLRRFILAHHSPKTDGHMAVAPVCAATWGGMESVHHLQQIEDIRAHKLAYDYYWIDAGWYGPAGSFSPDVYTGEWAKYVGHWEVNPRAHPQGLKPLADAAHAAGVKFLLWLEPERALSGTPWTTAHPEWFLGERKEGGSLLFNLGNPEARRFLTDFISGMIRDIGIDCYRQDFNIEPLLFWRAADAPDRQGMTEIRHVEGLYAFWDELLRRHPGLLIDNCASGGRRIDLETVGRSIPLWRSDYQCQPPFDPAGCQVQTHGLSYWIPLHGGGTCGGTHDPRRGDTYNVRSNFSASLEFPIYFNQGDGVPDHPWDWQHRMIEEYKRARPFFYGDYYPLVGRTPAADAWMVMQFDRPDMGEGVVLAFRRQDSPFVSADCQIRVKADAEYVLEDADTGRTWRQSGRELLEHGLRLTIETARESRLVFYRAEG
ncbi:MAG: alpha-galactosidase [bacterium]